MISKGSGMSDNDKAKEALRKRQQAERKEKEAVKKKRDAREHEETFFQREGEAAGEDVATMAAGNLADSLQTNRRYHQAHKEKQTAEKLQEEARQLKTKASSSTRKRID